MKKDKRQKKKKLYIFSFLSNNVFEFTDLSFLTMFGLKWRHICCIVRSHVKPVCLITLCWSVFLFYCYHMWHSRVLSIICAFGPFSSSILSKKISVRIRLTSSFSVLINNLSIIHIRSVTERVEKMRVDASKDDAIATSLFQERRGFQNVS
jgi:hypothetical protein